MTHAGEGGRPPIREELAKITEKWRRMMDAYTAATKGIENHPETWVTIDTLSDTAQRQLNDLFDGNVPDPSNFIPSLRANKQALEEFIAEIHTAVVKEAIEHDYIADGRPYKEEIAMEFGDEFFAMCLYALRANRGKLKIVSFGGGRLLAVSELYPMLEEKARAEGIMPDISIIDYSMSREMLNGALATGRRGGYELFKNVQRLVEHGKLRVIPGPLELTDVSEAQNADIMVSTFGPFYYALGIDEVYTAELLAKAARQLSHQRRGFFHVEEAPQEGEAGEIKVHASIANLLARTHRLLGDEYTLHLEKGRGRPEGKGSYHITIDHA